jgi:hypothetical protein
MLINIKLHKFKILMINYKTKWQLIYQKEIKYNKLRM